MGAYQPLYIAGVHSGLIQERQEFLLPNDAYPVLENAFVWRERIKRKQGAELLGRLRRNLTGQILGTTDLSGNFSVNIRTQLSLEANADIEPKTLIVTVGLSAYTDVDGLGTLSPSGTINYATTNMTITGATPSSAVTAAFSYFPSLPCTGIRLQETNSIVYEQTIYFDTKYAYIALSTGFQEWIPGTTWTGSDSNFFWTTNYWNSPAPGNNKLFWATNFSGQGGDPIRYTDGSAWYSFAPQINASSDLLNQCLCMIPFRGRLVAFNTLEGTSLAAAAPYSNRIRWAAIGNPITTTNALFPSGQVNANAWRSDIRGQGGFSDIPTTEAITSVGFVRDNVVVYCERSTWQLRYTGQSISPFIIEKVNTEIGARSTFSLISFDTTLVGMGDKGMVSCDSYQANLISEKIPDLVFDIINTSNAPFRVQAMRDFQKRLAYWIYPYGDAGAEDVIYPNRRLVYNYENESWAIFTDNFTALGPYQTINSTTWALSDQSWDETEVPWASKEKYLPDIAAGNQEGYIMNLDQQQTNGVGLTIMAIGGTSPVSFFVPNHNLQVGIFIKIFNIPSNTPYSSLNNVVFQVSKVVDANTLNLFTYDSVEGVFLTPVRPESGTYIGAGQMSILDNFNIQSKKFSFVDEGQNLQIGFIDLLMDTTTDGSLTLNVFQNYNNSQPVNQYPQNTDSTTNDADEVFNTTIPTSQNGGIPSQKAWQRVFCPIRGNFITLQYCLSPEQMNGSSQSSYVEIDAQVIWMRKAGRNLT